MLENEEYYIHQINLIMKNCWRMSISEDNALKEVRRYINKIDLNEEKHPFLITYRQELNNIIKYEPFNKMRIDDLHRSLFAYRNKISKEKSL